MANILLIDDDEQLRSMLREALEEKGHTVVESQDGREGVALYQVNAIDLVICDLVMPGRGGISTIQELSTMFPAVKIITMSGFSRGPGMNALEFTKELGALATLTKPFEITEMLEVIDNALPIS